MYYECPVPYCPPLQVFNLEGSCDGSPISLDGSKSKVEINVDFTGTPERSCQGVHDGVCGPMDLVGMMGQTT